MRMAGPPYQVDDDNFHRSIVISFFIIFIFLIKNSYTMQKPSIALIPFHHAGIKRTEIEMFRFQKCLLLFII